MLKTLRSRLLLSYVMVILVALLVVAVAMLAFASQPGIRYFVTLQRLDDVSRTSSNELVRLVQAGATDRVHEQVVSEFQKKAINCYFQGLQTEKENNRMA